MSKPNVETDELKPYDVLLVRFEEGEQIFLSSRIKEGGAVVGWRLENRGTSAAAWKPARLDRNDPRILGRSAATDEEIKLLGLPRDVLWIGWEGPRS